MPAYPENQQFIVTIDDVNTNTLIANVRDRANGQFGISYANPNTAAVTAPKPGEQWMAIRNGFLWSLVSRYETGNESVRDTELSPGDTRVGSEGDLYLIGDKVFLNKNPLGLMTWDRFLIPATGLWQVVLQHKPLSLKTIQAFSNGNLIDPFLLNLVADVLIGKPRIKFSEGILIVYYQYQP